MSPYVKRSSTAAAADGAADSPGARGRVALIAGATGLVGRELLARLLDDAECAQIHSVGRRAPAVAHPKVVEHVVDLVRGAGAGAGGGHGERDAAGSTVLPALASLPPVDDVFIALGTTIRIAGSQAAFRAVDFDAVVAVARAGRAAGATRIGVVSAMGADARSRVFYSRVKGEMEDAVARLGFAAVVFARPSLIVGDRAALGQPGRSGESWALRLMRVLPWTPANYRPIAAGAIAAALIAAIREGRPGVQVLASGRMQPAR